MLPQDFELGPLMDSSNMLWISAILASMPIVVTVAIAIAVAHGRRVRRKHEGDQGHR